MSRCKADATGVNDPPPPPRVYLIMFYVFLFYFFPFYFYTYILHWKQHFSTTYSTNFGWQRER